MSGRPGLVLDQEWIHLEFDIRLWEYVDAKRELGISQSTVHRILHGAPMSRRVLKKVLDGLYRCKPFRELEDALPTAKRELLRRRRRELAGVE